MKGAMTELKGARTELKGARNGREPIEWKRERTDIDGG